MKAEQLTPKAIFLDALDVAPDQRQAYVVEQCAGDVELRAEVEALLLHHQNLGPFLTSAPADRVATVEHDPSTEKPGTVIGRYKLLEQIGEGGFGVVFLAEQQQPVRRRVALKILKPGMDTREVVARFEAERQALAMMNHRHISKALDAGATNTGRPYFVMELVEGIPITEYCDHCNLTTRERLELFTAVCQAVQHAHQKGVIHRDLKPTNILVAIEDGKPSPKIIDFGVAKAVNQRLTEQSLHTAFTQLIGSPLYMSPEQAELSPLGVDTRSDIYSLGVLLYELLTGTTPFEKERFHEVGYDELRRIIREEEPPRPSDRFSTLGARAETVAENRRTDTKKLRQLVCGDLDWIVMKALEKDRNRRYETAGALLHDVQRYLADQPIEACPPSTLYRVSKFARRNRAGLMITSVIGLALLMVVGVAGWVVRDRAVRHAAIDQQVEQALKESQTWYQSGKLTEAMSAVKRAHGLLASDGSIEKQLQSKVSQWQTDLETVDRMEQIRLDQASLPDKSRDIKPARKQIDPPESETQEEIEFQARGLDQAGANKAYEQEFRRYGLDLDSLDVEKSAEHIRNSLVKQELVAVLTTGTTSHKSQSLGRTILLEKKRYCKSPGWPIPIPGAIGSARRDPAR